ncbi:MAG: phnN [Betaproteobacteria bacterium]|nr:phnN [Betaproteobacteria bacterium]
MSGRRLYYVVGASGVGKDSLIRYARDALGEAHAVVFAHRYITRAPGAGSENHVELTRPEFALRKRHGLFAMAWQSHGYHYGIGVEIDRWLSTDLAVVVNGSRSYIPAARRRYPEMKIVWVSAKPHVLAARLAHRGRESSGEITERLKRNDRLGVEPPPGALHISNEGTIEAAGAQLVELLCSS